MISSATFHVIATELVVGSFAMAGICFLVKTLQSFNFLASKTISEVTDNTGQFCTWFWVNCHAFCNHVRDFFIPWLRYFVTIVD